MKYLIMVLAIIAVVVIEFAGVPRAFAARNCPHGGFCPPGTCAKFNGVRYACNIKNCSAANCTR